MSAIKKGDVIITDGYEQAICVFFLQQEIILKNPYLYNALVAAVGIAATQADNTPSNSDHEKCYGVAKAGENDCNGTSSDGEKQSCPGWSMKDNDPYAWSYVPKGKCLQMGGKLNPPPLPPKNSETSE